jgi:hypothetical protein
VACEGLSLLGSELLRSCGPQDELAQEAVRRFGIVVQHPVGSQREGMHLAESGGQR